MNCCLAAVAVRLDHQPAGDRVGDRGTEVAANDVQAQIQADLEAGVPGLIVVDSRGDEAWAQGHLPGAVHLPTRQIAARAAEIIPAGATVVTSCWGPGCNGATRAAREFATLGYEVKEMIGGYEYWVREGLPVRTGTGVTRRAADDLVAPSNADSCAC